MFSPSTAGDGPSCASGNVASRKRKAPPATATETREQGHLQEGPENGNSPKRRKVSEASEQALAKNLHVKDSIVVHLQGIDTEMTDSPKAMNDSTPVGETKKLQTPGVRQYTTTTGVPEPKAAKAALTSHAIKNNPVPSETNGDSRRATSTIPNKVHRTKGPVSRAALTAGVTTTGPNRYVQIATEPVLEPGESEGEDPVVPAKASNAIFPAINLGNHFNTTLPAAHQPWPYDFPQAHCVYSKRVNCPINWNTFKNIPLAQQRVYELRRPWSVSSAPWDTVRMKLADLESKTAMSAEGVRKRFAKVNKTIFETTGVYFACNGHGLQKGYGVPNDVDMSAMLKGHGGTTLGDPMKATKAYKDSHWKVDRIEEDDVATIVLQLPGQSFRAIRYIPKELMAELKISDGQTLPYAATTFDRWYSCFVFGSRHNLPKRVYRLKQQPDHSYISVDEGTPMVTVQTLLETYCLSQLAGTTAVSDMLLDEMMQSLENEKHIYETYGTGQVCEQHCNDVVRLLDLQPEDIQRLWKNTKIQDPIRKLLIDLFLHDMDVEVEEGKVVAKIRTDAFRLSRCACQLWEDFTEQDHRKVIESFLGGTDPGIFCARYHNHQEGGSCYRSTLLSKHSKHMIDDTLDEPNVHLLGIRGVAWFRIINKTCDRLDLEALRAEQPRWNWDRVRSINSWIHIKPNGPQHRQPHPVYFDPSEMDRHGRFPSHPGYQKEARALGSRKDDKNDG